MRDRMARVVNSFDRLSQGRVVSRNCPALAIGSSIEDTGGCNQVRARACGIESVRP